MEAGGVAAMEVLARDLKALGLYAARARCRAGCPGRAVPHRSCHRRRTGPRHTRDHRTGLPDPRLDPGRPDADPGALRALRGPVPDHRRRPNPSDQAGPERRHGLDGAAQARLPAKNFTYPTYPTPALFPRANLCMRNFPFMRVILLLLLNHK